MLFNFYFINQNSKHQKNETKEVIRIINSGSRRRKKMIYIVVWYIYIYILSPTSSKIQSIVSNNKIKTRHRNITLLLV